MSNIWTAASEGDLARVTELVQSGLSPSIPDENTYTPLHAAASWNHFDILRYLVAQGGNINITDSDGETPLFLVETAEMARVVVELGGDIAHRNTEGLTAAESLLEEQPHISLYLRSLSGDLTPLPSSATLTSTSTTLSPNATEPELERSTDDLLQRVRVIMEASERGEISPEETDEKLREVVESAVQGQVEVGREIGSAMEDADEPGLGRVREEDEKDDEMDVGGGTGKRRKPDVGR